VLRAQVEGDDWKRHLRGREQWRRWGGRGRREARADCPAPGAEICAELLFGSAFLLDFVWLLATFVWKRLDPAIPVILCALYIVLVPYAGDNPSVSYGVSRGNL
jgi:hypothetical protein